MATLQGKAAITTLQDGDLVTIHDVSATAEDAAGDLKKITVANLDTHLSATTKALTNKTISTATNTLTGTAAGLTVGATTGVEAGADVTDATNVAAAGASMTSSGAGAPATTPAAVGNIYTDTTADTTYIATGVASSADWDLQLSTTSGTVLADTQIVAGDSIPFFDVDDSSNAKKRLASSAITDLGIALLAGPTFTGTVTMPATVVLGANNFVRSGAHSLTLTTGATTNVSLPASGTLAILGANTFTGTQDFNGQQVEGMLNKVVTSVTGTLTTTAHSGNVLVTTGSVTVPTTAGFNAIIVAGGAHTVTFNATTSAAMAAGDIMTVAVQSATVIQAVLTAAADKVTFS
jgi:hypothetical protein